MKKVEAIIRKSKFNMVVEALHDAGIEFFSYWDVTGVGNERKGHVYRGTVYNTSDIQRRFLSIVVREKFLQPTIDAILKVAKTGEYGDGKIFVSEVLDSYRIRTGEHGDASLYIGEE